MLTTPSLSSSLSNTDHQHSLNLPHPFWIPSPPLPRMHSPAAAFFTSSDYTAHICFDVQLVFVHTTSTNNLLTVVLTRNSSQCNVCTTARYVSLRLWLPLWTNPGSKKTRNKPNFESTSVCFSGKLVLRRLVWHGRGGGDIPQI